MAVGTVHAENAAALTLGTLVPSITGITNDGAGNLTVAFSVVDGTGAPVVGLTSGDAMLGDLIPAGTVAGWDSVYGQEWEWVYGMASFTDLTGGKYTYTVHGNLVALEADDAGHPQFSAAYTQRVIIRVGNGVSHRPAVAIQDFTLTGGAPTGAPVLVDPVAVKAPTDGCYKCHTEGMLGMPANPAHAGHPSWFNDTRACVLCHSPAPFGYAGQVMIDDSAYLSRFVHAIHAAKSSAEIPGFASFEEGGSHQIFPDANGVHQGFGAVTYPQKLANCSACHTGNGHMTDDWNTNPTMEVCSSCHTTIDFTGGTFVGLDGASKTHLPQASNAMCAACHTGSGSAISVVDAHASALVPAAIDRPEFNVSIDITGATGSGGVFVAGDVPKVTVTLTAADGGAAVAYAAAADTNNDRDGVLKEASLVVYGPRAHADLVLGGGGSLLLPTTDAHVQTTASGFVYVMDPIPAGMAAGTYLVRFEAGDYGTPSAIDYVTHSSAVKAFQVGTATVEAKVSGDKCTDCHGSNRVHLQGAHPHNAAFDTDECLACHNFSGGYGTPISQRVHAIHSASEVGADGHGREWSNVTFPQSDVAESFEGRKSSRCVACHDGASQTYLAPANRTQPAQWGTPCLGCHGDKPGALDHMLQNGAPL